MNSDPKTPGLEPLAGEAGIPSVNAPRKGNLSWKAVVTLGLLALVLVAMAVVGVKRLTAPNPAKAEAKAMAAAPKPVSATSKTANVEVPGAAAPASAVAVPGKPSSGGTTVPAIDPSDEEAAPIPVRGREGSPAGRTAQPGKSRTIDPTDAPLMVTSDSRGLSASAKAGSSGTGVPDEANALAPNGASHSSDPLEATRANMREYREQLQGMLRNLQNVTDAATKGRAPTGTGAGPGAATGAVGSPFPAAAGTFSGSPAAEGGATTNGTARVYAGTLGNRSLTLPKGTTFTCALKTQVIASASGPVSCQVMRNVYSDNGRVLLIERGTHVDGDYKMQNVRPGMVSIPAIWTRLRMPNGVVVDLDSPATGPLGAAGIDGTVDNRWPERIGAALMVSLIGDSIQIAIADQQDGASLATTTGTYAQTTTTTGALASEVLKSTINLPPIIYKNQGGVVGVYVSKDVNFETVYALKVADERR